ncbi:hypothetical protein ACHAXR_001058 [Thalassiosira sp. AJA248-18]
MKTQNLLCCASLAFVNQRVFDRTGGGNKMRPSYLVRQKQLQLHLMDENGSESGDIYSDGHSQSRRLVLSKYFLSSMLLVTTNAKSARAACLSGDIRAECIGVYKVDASHSSYAETPEKLKLYAPDLQWVPPVEYPPNYGDALNQLKEQRQQLDIAQEIVAKGDIEKSGLELLAIIVKVNAAGTVIIKSFRNASNEERNAAMKRNNPTPGNDGNPSSTTKAITLEMKTDRIENTFNELLALLGETDVMIGQALRGELGVSAPAQIQILSNISDCKKEFDNLILEVPEKVE